MSNSICPGICTMYLVLIIYKQSKFRSEKFDILSDFNFLIIHISNPGFTTEKPTLIVLVRRRFAHSSLQHTYVGTGTVTFRKVNQCNGEAEADPASLFLARSLQLHHRTGTRAAKSEW